MLKLDRTKFQEIVQEALNGKEETKARYIRARIMDTLYSDGMVNIVFTKEWLTQKVYKAGLKNDDGNSTILRWLSKVIRNSDLSLACKYVLYNYKRDTSKYVEADNYSDLYLQGDAMYDFLDMYCDLMEKYNNTYNDCLEALKLNK